MIDQRYLPNFNIIICGDGNLHFQADVMVTALKFSLMRIKLNLLAIGCDSRRLIACRPDRPIVAILSVNPATPVVARRVGLPTGESQPLPLTVTAASARNERAKTSVREDMDLRQCSIDRDRPW